MTGGGLAETFAPGSPKHPFLVGRQWRRDELGDAVLTSAHWRWMAWLVTLGWLLTGSVWGVREMLREPIRVAMVTVDPSGATRVLGFIPERYQLKDAVIQREVRTFVEILRRSMADKVLMGEDWDEKKGIYGRVTSNGRKLLDQYVREHGDPLQRQEFVMVEVVRNLPRGKQTRDVSWTEQRFSPEMEPLDTVPTRWSGIFSYSERTPRTESELSVNPLGIWLDQWSFSREQ